MGLVLWLELSVCLTVGSNYNKNPISMRQCSKEMKYPLLGVLRDALQPLRRKGCQAELTSASSCSDDGAP